MRQTYSGTGDSVFFLTATLACGEEVLWDFVNSITNLRVSLSFTQFCKMKTRDYKSIHLRSANFVLQKFCASVLLLGGMYGPRFSPRSGPLVQT